ncbi:hypothetical protein LI177_12550 [bacterium 210820-DFI.6.37]|nr:hypothetical protein [bacterium 210820-DFI.6.37]
MENKVFCYDKSQCFPHAEEFFVEACGFDPGIERHRKRMAQAVRLLEREKGNFKMRAICARLGKEAYENGAVTAAGDRICCPGFSYIQEALDVWMCVVTAGDWTLKNSTKTGDQVYMDIWGTAFADGAKTLFERDLTAMLPKDQYLSCPFGPGYYGMPSADTKKFAKALDLKRIGVTVRDSGIMIPLKSIAAVYFVTAKKSPPPPLACSQCFGRLEGCRNCSQNKK